jgi:hypothetical protein
MYRKTGVLLVLHRRDNLHIYFSNSSSRKPWLFTVILLFVSIFFCCGITARVIVVLVGKPRRMYAIMCLTIQLNSLSRLGETSNPKKGSFRGNILLELYRTD